MKQPQDPESLREPTTPVFAFEQRSVDSLPIRSATLAVLDRDRVATHIADARARGRYKGPTDVDAYLYQKQCVVQEGDAVYPTLAGVLCFGHAPQAVVPIAMVDLGHYRGTVTVSYEVTHLEKGIDGTIFEQLTRVETYLWNNIHHGMTLAPNSLQRVEEHEYPQVVIRELLVNLLAHRDYAQAAAAARVMLFRDRIEWVSPGGLPPGITIENLLDEQAPRNPIILSILYEAGFMEGFGQGLNTVVEVLKREQLPAPIFRDTGTSFIVTVYGRPRSQDAQARQYAQLSDTQRQILTFVRSQGEASPAAIRQLVGERARRSIQRDIQGLVEARLITAVGEGRALRYYPAGGAE